MTNSLVHSFQSETLCLLEAYHVVPKFRAITPILLSIMLQNKQYCVNWNLIEMVMQYFFSLSVIKPLKRCNSASINLGNTLHTLNRGKLSPELFASSFNLRSGGGVFKQHHQPFVPSSDWPRFTVRKATTAVGRLTKQESHSRMFSVKIPGVRTMFPC